MQGNIAVPESEALRFSQESAVTVSQMRSIEVTDQDTYDLAASTLRSVAEWRRKVTEFFRPIKEQAYQLHQTICRREKAVLEPVEMAEQQTRRNLANYALDMERKRKEAELEAASAQKKREEDDRIAAAAKAEKLGASPEAVDQILNEPLPPAPPPKIAPMIDKAAGIHTMAVWKWRFEGSELTALQQLVKAAAKDKKLLGFLSFNQTALTATAKALKSAADVPGIEFYEEATTVVRR